MDDSEAKHSNLVEATSKKDTFFALFRMPKLSSKAKQRYNMSRVEESARFTSTKFECGCLVDYFKRAFVSSSNWCNGDSNAGTIVKLKPCSWSQVEIVRNESVASDEFCGSSTASVTASDSGLSSGDDTSAESSPKLASACTRFADAIDLVDRPGSPDLAVPPVKPPRLLKKRKETSAPPAHENEATSSTIPVVVRNFNEVVAVTVQVSWLSLKVKVKLRRLE